MKGKYYVIGSMGIVKQSAVIRVQDLFGVLWSATATEGNCNVLLMDTWCYLLL